MLKINGMSCSHCVKTVENALTHEGITGKKVSLESSVAEIQYDPEKISVDEIVRLIDLTELFTVEKRAV